MVEGRDEICESYYTNAHLQNDQIGCASILKWLSWPTRQVARGNFTRQFVSWYKRSVSYPVNCSSSSFLRMGSDMIPGGEEEKLVPDIIMGGVLQEQKIIMGNLPRVIYHRVYFSIRRINSCTSVRSVPRLRTQTQRTWRLLETAYIYIYIYIYIMVHNLYDRKHTECII